MPKYENEPDENEIFNLRRSLVAPLQPHNREAEEACLGAMLYGGTKTVMVVSQLVTAEDFWWMSNQHIFHAITSLVQKGEPCDARNVSVLLREQGLLEQCGGWQTVGRMQTDTPTMGDAAPAYAKVVASLALRRALIAAHAAAVVRLQDEMLRSPSELAAETVEVIQRLLEHRPGVSSWNPIDLTDYWADTENRVDIPGILGVRVDGATLVRSGQRGLLVARRESGKSMLVLSMAIEAAKQGRHTFVIDFESRPQDVIQRLRLHVDGGVAERFFHYVRPEDPLDAVGRYGVKQLVELYDPALVVIDGFNALLATQGLKGNDATDIAKLYQQVAEPWESSTGTLILTDHISKEGLQIGNLSAMGSVAKENLVDFVINLEVDETERIMRNATGSSNIRISKDRNGLTRPVCNGDWSFGRFTVNSSRFGRWQHGITMPAGMSGPPLTWTRS